MTPKTGAALRNELTDALLGFRRVFYAVGAFSCAVNLLLLVPAIYMLQVYDRVLMSRNELTLLMLTLIVVALFLLEGTLEFVRSRVLVRAGAALDLRLGQRVFEASFERALAGRGGSAMQTLGDLTNVRQFLTSQGLFVFFDTPWTPIFIVVIALLHPWLGLFALVASVLLLLMAFLMERMTGRTLAEAARVAAGANQYAAANLRNAEAIEAMGMLGRLRSRWFERHALFLSLQAEASDRAGAINAAVKFLRLALQSGILGLGAWLAIRNELTPGAMIAAAILLGRALAPVELGIATWRGFVAAREAYARLAALLQAHPARATALELPRPAGTVSAETLTVAAPGGREAILKGLNFRLPAGSTVAIIGPSASGKSTLARALVGVWAPLHGSLRLDGAEVHRWDKAALGPWIGYLPQDVELLEGTVAENVARFGALDSEKIVAAAKRAGVHELVLQLPQGYETQIGEGGAALSGGQRQRIALARALYGDPALVVLDEPNANLDKAGDAALIEALRAMKREGCTVFVVTHRVNVLNVVDAVMVLVGGTLQAFGPRESMLKNVRSLSSCSEEFREESGPRREDVA